MAGAKVEAPLKGGFNNAGAGKTKPQDGGMRSHTTEDDKSVVEADISVAQRVGFQNLSGAGCWINAATQAVLCSKRLLEYLVQAEGERERERERERKRERESWT